MIPNSSRCCGRQSTLAPASSSMHGPLAVGTTAPIVGRLTPLIRPRISVEADMTAPVFPALRNAWAFPSWWSRSPTAMDDSLLLRRAAVGESDISMTSGAWTISTGIPVDAGSPAAANSCSMRLRSPTRTTVNRPPDSRAASTAPRTTFRGAKSPPIASTAIRICAGVLVNENVTTKGCWI